MTVRAESFARDFRMRRVLSRFFHVLSTLIDNCRNSGSVLSGFCRFWGHLLVTEPPGFEPVVSGCGCRNWFNGRSRFLKGLPGEIGLCGFQRTLAAFTGPYT